MKRLLVALALCAIAAWPSQAIEFTATQSGRISFAVSKLLERYHYRQSTVDDALSEKFLRTYLNTLDYNHLIFQFSILWIFYLYHIHFYFIFLYSFKYFFNLLMNYFEFHLAHFN